MILLRLGLAVEELAGLAEMIGEGLGPMANLRALHRLRKAMITGLGVLPRRVHSEAVGLIVYPSRRNLHLHVAVALEVGHGAARLVDRDLVEVGAAETRKLRIEVGEVAALQQRVVA